MAEIDNKVYFKAGTRPFEGPMKRAGRQLKELAIRQPRSALRLGDSGDEIDNQAFDNMRRVTDGAPDRLFEKGRMFTESEYNTKATTEERNKYDSKAYFLLKDLYNEDKKKDRFQTLNFSQYLQNLDNDYIEEKFLHARKDDPEFYKDAGNLLSDIYGGDPEQLKLSAYNTYAGIGTPEQTKGYQRDRSNVSIKAPGAERY